MQNSPIFALCSNIQKSIFLIFGTNHSTILFFYHSTTLMLNFVQIRRPRGHGLMHPAKSIGKCTDIIANSFLSQTAQKKKESGMADRILHVILLLDYVLDGYLHIPLIPRVSLLHHTTSTPLLVRRAGICQRTCDNNRLDLLKFPVLVPYANKRQ